MFSNIALANNGIQAAKLIEEKPVEKLEAVQPPAGFLGGKKVVPFMSAGVFLISLLASIIITGVGAAIAVTMATPVAIIGGCALIFGAVVLLVGVAIRHNRKTKAFFEELRNKILPEKLECKDLGELRQIPWNLDNRSVTIKINEEDLKAIPAGKKTQSLAGVCQKIQDLPFVITFTQVDNQKFANAIAFDPRMQYKKFIIEYQDKDLKVTNVEINDYKWVDINRLNLLPVNA